jgi:hypothetical protein
MRQVEKVLVLLWILLMVLNGLTFYMVVNLGGAAESETPQAKTESAEAAQKAAALAASQAAGEQRAQLDAVEKRLRGALEQAIETRVAKLGRDLDKKLNAIEAYLKPVEEGPPPPIGAATPPGSLDVPKVRDLPVEFSRPPDADSNGAGDSEKAPSPDESGGRS